ncbi:MAG: sigma-54-dependent transcriptional regulator, partial [Bradyrhizobium sp.]
MALEVLIVDDEADIRELVSGVLEDEGYAVRAAADSTQTLDAIEERRPSMVLLDVWLQGSKLDGLQLLQEIKQRDPTIPVLVISGHGNLDTAVAAVREGAVDFIEKPFEAERLIYLVDRATETERLRRENETLRLQVGQEDQLQGSSVAINTVRATLKRVAPTGSRVLISGPPGVGKEIAARMIHQWSPRARAPFIVLSAAMMSPDRVEEELFGSESDGVIRSGLLEHAHGGTLFLDEIADMPLTTQAKILRVLTDQSYTRVGGQRPVKVDVRVLSATSRNLQDEISAGRFREDLYYRLNVVPVRLPPLRERREDIPELVSHFLARISAERRMAAPSISEEAMAALQAHDWPGNVRQLRNIIERTLILAPGDRAARIEVDLLPPEVLDNQSAMSGANSGMAIMGSPLREAR